MSRVSGKRLELVCVLCNESLADVEKACSGLPNSSKNDSECKTSLGGAASGSVSKTNTAFKEVSRQPSSSYVNRDVKEAKESQKDVVATKCGHMFHQGCLRKYVHKTLIEGKGGSLFCPICTRPFAMNRLWPVIIPATKPQRERFMQLNLMKQQNIDMVKQLKEIRGRISEEENRLQRIKEDSEQCLQDIQQKQKLLDSVNGPTNKEMVDLTRMHMKRQEILHVVTQHNADLLKLLAEESNISTSCAEQMISVRGKGSETDRVQDLSPAITPIETGRKPASSVFSQLVPTLKKKRSKTKKKEKSDDKSEKKKEKSDDKSEKKKKKSKRITLLETVSDVTCTMRQSDDSEMVPNPSDMIPANPLMKKLPGLIVKGKATDSSFNWNNYGRQNYIALPENKRAH